MYKVRVKMLEPSTSKLYLVKSIKDLCGLGLLDAKNIIDELHSGYEQTIILRSREDVDTLKKQFNEHGKFKINGGVDHDRNIQLLSIGLGSPQEYIDEISDRIFFQLDVESSKLILNFALSKLTQENLVEILNESNSFING
jgi:hypothetical protein